MYGINIANGNPFGVVFNILSAILIEAPITGASFNPAVSTAILINHPTPIRALP